jgi:hypothetical protein
VDVYKSNKVSKRNVDHIRELLLRLLGTQRDAFIRAVRDAWVKASNYVHLTKAQIDEKLRLRAAGISLGFETTEMLADVATDVHDACSIVVILAFETIGPSFTGDILVGGLDAQDEWPFHASEFVAAVDSHFDYKHERQPMLEKHIERRLHRIRDQSTVAV